MRERRTNLVKRVAFEELRMNLLRRLSGVCAHMSKTELDALAANMTRLRQKYATTTAVPLD
jgi:hypothetical protein